MSASWRETAPTTKPTTFKTQIQQESPHNLHKGHFQSTQIRRSRNLHHWVPQDLPCKSTPQYMDSKQISLIDRNKQKETAKIGRQRNHLQAKEKEASPEKEVSEIEASKLADIKFKVMVIRMLKELNENYTSMKKDIEAINKNQLEMKNIPEGIKIRLHKAEDGISNLED